MPLPNPRTHPLPAAILVIAVAPAVPAIMVAALVHPGRADPAAGGELAFTPSIPARPRWRADRDADDLGGGRNRHRYRHRSGRNPGNRKHMKNFHVRILCTYTRIPL